MRGMPCGHDARALNSCLNMKRQEELNDFSDWRVVSECAYRGAMAIMQTGRSVWRAARVETCNMLGDGNVGL
jgi:hypothetical protein